MNLIDLDLLLEKLEWLKEYDRIVFHDVKLSIDEVPAVNAIPVVRCKDCMWFKTNHTWSGREYKVCVREAYEPMREDEDYCSGGRRRDEDDH